MKSKAAAVLLLLAATAIFAVAQISNSVTADIPFQFYVGSKLLPAGVYKIAASANLDEITVKGPSGKDNAMAAVSTRLSTRSDKESNLVFDVAGESHYLAEIYMQGIDGFQIQAAKVKHTHMSVIGK